VPLAWVLLPLIWGVANPPRDDPDADVHYWRLPGTRR